MLEGYGALRRGACEDSDSSYNMIDKAKMKISGKCDLRSWFLDPDPRM